jgi:seryl-tRNA synthetase
MIRFHESGEVSLSGPAQALAADADRAFTLLAARWDAAPERHPVTIGVDVLARTGYLASFPHQVNFAGNRVLTPAACYHLYPAREGQKLDGPLYLTTVNTCFRRETAYVPLRRQWSFTMREIVCVGTQAEVTAFLDRARELAGALCDLAGIQITWEHATDPFYRADDPGYLMQKVAPVKFEARRGDLAIASVNAHHDHFGATFGIQRAGEPAHSGCLAFGIERWLAAIFDCHGGDPSNWPDLVALAAKLVDAP